VPELLQAADCTRSSQLLDGCRNPCYVESILNPIHIEVIPDSLSKHKSLKDASKR
jgi:L-fucose isomerase-like protein